MKQENQKISSYEIAMDRVFFGRPYHLTVNFSPAPADIHRAQIEAEAIAEKMVRDVMISKIFGYDVRFPSTWPPAFVD